MINITLRAHLTGSTATHLTVGAHSSLVQLGLDVIQSMLRLGCLSVALRDVQEMTYPLAQRFEDDAADDMVAIVGRQIATELVEVRVQASQLDVRGLRLADGLMHIAIDIWHGDGEVGIVYLQLLDVPQRQIDRPAGLRSSDSAPESRNPASNSILSDYWPECACPSKPITYPSAAAWCSPDIPPSPGSRICPRWSNSSENSSFRSLRGPAL